MRRSAALGVLCIPSAAVNDATAYPGPALCSASGVKKFYSVELSKLSRWLNGLRVNKKPRRYAARAFSGG
jgi:hypothetical protein